MSSLYHYVGLIVVWALIIAIAMLTGWGIYHAIRYLTKRAWFRYYIFCWEHIPTETIRAVYPKCPVKWHKWILKDRLRNIRRASK